MPPALDVRLRGAGQRAETPGSQRKDAAFRWLELLAMSRRASAQSTLRAAGEHRAPELGQGAGRSGRAPRMGTVRLGHRGTKPQPTPRPLRTPSLVAAPPPPPQPSAVRSRTRPRKPPQAIQPSAAPLGGRRHCPACCGRGLVTPRPHSPLTSLLRVLCAAAGPAPSGELARTGCDVNLRVADGGAAKAPLQ